MPDKIAYLMSRFPLVTETFILYEILELERLGLKIDIFPLIRETGQSVIHDEAHRLVEEAHYHSMRSGPVWRAQFYWLWKRPWAYLKTWWKALRGNISSPKFLSRAVVVVPLAATFAREIEALGIEHVHAHYGTHPALAAFVIRQLADVPYSITIHAHDLYVDRAMLGPKLNAAKLIVSVSNFNRNMMGDLYGAAVAEKTQIIRCGTDPALFAPRDFQKTGDEFNIICLGTLLEMKGQTYLIEACKQLIAQGVAVRCQFIGDGVDRHMLEEQIQRAGLADTVTILGYQPRLRVAELLSQADVMVLPSVIMDTGKMDGIPVSLMEAMAREIPVISTTVSGIPELVVNEETGLLVPPRDADALAQALLRLYQDSALAQQLGKQGREKVLAEYNIFTNTATLYQALTGNPPPVDTE